MAQTVRVAGATYSDVPAVELPKSTSGTATFYDVSDTTATAGDVASGKYFYTSAGVRTQGTSSGGGSTTLPLLKTYSMGTLSCSSTYAADTGKSTTVTGYGDYDVLVVEVLNDSPTNSRHLSTVSMVYITGTSSISTKNTYAVGYNKWNSKLGSTGTVSSRNNTSAYGIYVDAATVSGSTMTLTFYYRYNSNNTGTINGSYTARVYGLKLYEHIGG